MAEERELIIPIGLWVLKAACDRLAAWRVIPALRGLQLSVNVSPRQFRQHRFVPPPGACWDTGLYVRPEFRAGRAFAALWAGSAAWMAERSLDWSMSRIAAYNLDSLRSHARMGAVEIGSLTALKLGHRQWLTGGTETLCLRLPEPGQ